MKGTRQWGVGRLKLQAPKKFQDSKCNQNTPTYTSSLRLKLGVWRFHLLLRQDHAPVVAAGQQAIQLILLQLTLRSDQYAGGLIP